MQRANRGETEALPLLVLAPLLLLLCPAAAIAGWPATIGPPAPAIWLAACAAAAAAAAAAATAPHPASSRFRFLAVAISAALRLRHLVRLFWNQT